MCMLPDGKLHTYDENRNQLLGKLGPKDLLLEALFKGGEAVVSAGHH